MQLSILYKIPKGTTMQGELKIPRHIAFIMDGNGRWAKKRLLPRKAGHREGVVALKRMIEECEKAGVEMVTFYAFSTENWKRPQDEIDALFKMVKEFADKHLAEYVKRGYRIMFMGDLTKLPKETVDALRKILSEAKDNTGMIVNIALNYGGRDEILHAVNRILDTGVREVDMQTLSDCMYTGGLPDPDVIVRSSGEKRLSNFMLWQAAYAEFIFIDDYWPDFDAKIFRQILEEYSQRDRRYGNVRRIN